MTTLADQEMQDSLMELQQNQEKSLSETSLSFNSNELLSAKPMDSTAMSDMLGVSLDDPMALERAVFTAVNEGDTDHLKNVFSLYSSSTAVLQMLLTTSYPNRDNFYKHDPEVMQDAHELLGPSMEHLNAIQIACILGDEEIAMVILDFVVHVTDEIDARKVLYEFMGRIWGNGNTVLHLASFLGMSELVKRLLELGAAPGKFNERKYRPVDCADDDCTRKMFETVTEIDQAKHHGAAKEISDKRNDILDLRLQAVPNASPRVISEPSGSHSKSSSWDSSSRQRADSASSSIEPGSPRDSRLRKLTKSGTVNGDFRIGELSRNQDASKSLAQSFKQPPPLKPKSKKTVGFDPSTMILHLCQHNDDPTVNRCDLVRSLLGLDLPVDSSKRIDVNSLFSPQQGLTPLHLACSHAAYDIALMLLQEAHVAVNVRDCEGWTPLHCASAEGNIPIIELLGRCQGVYGTEAENISKPECADWLYPIDGPIDLIPLNEDDEIPEDIAFDGKQDQIAALFQTLKTKYPPPPQNVYEVDNNYIDEGDLDDLEESDDDEIDEIAGQKKHRSKEHKSMPFGFSHAPSMMKSALRRKDPEDADKSLMGDLVANSRSVDPSALLAEGNVITSPVLCSNSDELNSVSSSTPQISGSISTHLSQKESTTYTEPSKNIIDLEKVSSTLQQSEKAFSGLAQEHQSESFKRSTEINQPAACYSSNTVVSAILDPVPGALRISNGNSNQFVESNITLSKGDSSDASIHQNKADVLTETESTQNKASNALKLIDTLSTPRSNLETRLSIESKRQQTTPAQNTLHATEESQTIESEKITTVASTNVLTDQCNGKSGIPQKNLTETTSSQSVASNTPSTLGLISRIPVPTSPKSRMTAAIQSSTLTCSSSPSLAKKLSASHKVTEQHQSTIKDAETNAKIASKPAKVSRGIYGFLDGMKSTQSIEDLETQLHNPTSLGFVSCTPDLLTASHLNTDFSNTKLETVGSDNTSKDLPRIQESQKKAPEAPTSAVLHNTKPEASTSMSLFGRLKEKFNKPGTVPPDPPNLSRSSSKSSMESLYKRKTDALPTSEVQDTLSKHKTNTVNFMAGSSKESETITEAVKSQSNTLVAVSTKHRDAKKVQNESSPLKESQTLQVPDESHVSNLEVSANSQDPLSSSAGLDTFASRKTRLRNGSQTRTHDQITSDFPWMRPANGPEVSGLVKSGEVLRRPSELSRRASKLVRDPESPSRTGIIPSLISHSSKKGEFKEMRSSESSFEMKPKYVGAQPPQDEVVATGTVDSIRQAFNRPGIVEANMPQTKQSPLRRLGGFTGQANSAAPRRALNSQTAVDTKPGISSTTTSPDKPMSTPSQQKPHYSSKIIPKPNEAIAEEPLSTPQPQANSSFILRADLEFSNNISGAMSKTASVRDRIKRFETSG
ncbi:hypothetical protein BDV3_003586 [Batrachochytrium dendrobatidis]